MNREQDTEKRFQMGFVLLLVFAISAVFLAMIRSFLMPLLLAAIFSGLAHPVYRWLVKKYRGRKVAASITTIILLLLLLLGPLSALIGLIATQAVEVSQSAIPWIKHQIDAGKPLEWESWLFAKAPWLESVVPSREQLMTGLGNLAEKAGGYLVSSAGAVGAGTAAFFLNLFVMLYGMFFFFMEGRNVLQKVFEYTPLTQEDDERMLDRFTSITRATVKGTLVIALIQGTLGGLAFAAAGIQGAAFWGAVMVVLSVIPGIGTALVWVPACIYLFAVGKTLTGILFLAFCAGVVGTIDNVLRPILVGKDAKMPDVLILVGTLGGLFFFGPTGFIIGPIVCGLFLTAWDIYGATFKDFLPHSGPLPGHDDDHGQDDVKKTEAPDPVEPGSPELEDHPPSPPEHLT